MVDLVPVVYVRDRDQRPGQQNEDAERNQCPHEDGIAGLAFHPGVAEYRARVRAGLVSVL